MKELKRGDNLSAWYPKVHAWVEAEVQEIDWGRNRIKFDFVGTPDIAYVPLTSSNISITHKNLNDPFNGVEEDYEWVHLDLAQVEKTSSDVQDTTDVQSTSEVPASVPSEVKDTEDKGKKPENEVQTAMQTQQTSSRCCQIL